MLGERGGWGGTTKKRKSGRGHEKEGKLFPHQVGGGALLPKRRGWTKKMCLSKEQHESLTPLGLSISETGKDRA